MDWIMNVYRQDAEHTIESLRRGLGRERHEFQVGEPKAQDAGRYLVQNNVVGLYVIEGTSIKSRVHAGVQG